MIPLKKYLLLPLLLINLLAPAVLSSSASAQNTGICDRTQAVQVVLLQKLNIVDCRSATDARLASITGDLSLSNKGISSIRANDFAGLSNTGRIFITDNQITSIEKDAFATLNQLTLILLSNNRLTTIPEGVFVSLNKLNFLRLNNNQITSINANSFDSLGALTVLQLNNNRIANIAANSFDSIDTLNALDLVNNSLTNLSVGTFDNSPVKSIDLSNNSITSLPLNLFAKHKNPASITKFNTSGNPVAASGWEITNVSWIKDPNTPNTFSLQIGHTLPQSITVNLSSNNGNLSPSPIVITKGNTLSNTVTWTATTSDPNANIVPTNQQINIGILNGHINIPTLDISGICDRSFAITTLLLNTLSVESCEDLTVSALTSLIGLLNWNNTAVPFLAANDLDHLTGITTFNLSNNNIVRLVDGSLSQTSPNTVNFSANNIADIGRSALFTNNTGADDISVNLSNNAISTATLASGFLTSNGNQQFVDGEFDLSFNQIDKIVASSFSGFNPKILHLNNNRISSIAANVFDNFATTQINLSSNNLASLPFNLLAAHTNPGSITSFDVSNNPLVGNSWEITDVRWVQDDNNPGSFTLHLGHALPENITIAITSANGGLSVDSITITKGNTLSNAVTWTATATPSDPNANIVPTSNLINVTTLGGHINIPTLAPAGVCDRSLTVTNLLLTATGAASCQLLTITQLMGLSGDLDWSNSALPYLAVNDVDNLTGINTFNFSSNNLTHLVNGILSQTQPDAVNFANNRISNIEKSALFTNNPGTDDLQVNLSSNAITAATLASGFLTSNVNQQFAGGAFDLSFNQINAVVASSFTNFNPSILRLNNNNIASIEDNALASSVDTTELYLNNNLLSDITVSTFAGLTNLNTLDLSNNNIALLPADVFDVLQQLAVLNLSSNNLNALDASFIQDLTATDIDLSFNNIASLPLNFLNSHTNPSSINSFNLSNNSLTNNTWEITSVSWVQDSTNSNRFSVQIEHALPEDITIAITSANGDLSVDSITITKGNEMSDTVDWTAKYSGEVAYITPTLEKINVASLSGHINIPQWYTANGICDRSQPIQNLLLTKLNRTDCTLITPFHLSTISDSVSWNSQAIQTVEATDFSGLFNVIGVYMDSNQISTIQPGAFNSLNKVAYLDLSTNRISSLPDNIFEPLNNLESLNLGSNRLTDFPTDTFGSSSNLDDLDLNDNQITTIPDNAFASFDSLQSLGLGSNRLGTVPTNAFGPLDQLKSLSLYSNNISTIATDAFDDLTRLEILDLSNNNLTLLPTSALSGLTNLKGLSLNNNNITAIPSDSFASLARLEILSLSDNNLQTIPAGAFTKLNSLNQLYMLNNNISVIELGAFANLTVTDIDLSNNNIAYLPINLLADHRYPEIINDLNLLNNPIASNSWEITNVSWGFYPDNPDNFALVIGHPLPEDITIDITSTNGDLSGDSITILKGETLSSTVVWTAFSGSIGADAYIIPTPAQVNISSLSGHINIPRLITGGICARSLEVRELLLNLTTLDDCAEVTESQLIALTGTIDLSNEELSDVLTHDLDNLTSIDTIILSDNNLTDLLNGTLNQTAPAAVDFANNNISFIEKLALFTTNQGEDDISVNLSSNAITTATLASGFLNANGAQRFVGGEFDLSFNQINAVVATSFAGFNPSVLHLNNNSIASIETNAFTDAAMLNRLNLANNLLTTIPTSTFTSLSALTQLNLSGNQLPAIHADSFSALSKLLVLALGNNNISSIEADSFASLNDLNLLYLHGNILQTVPSDAFRNLNATEIRLDSNNLTSLPLNLLANHADPSSITTFNVSGNPLPSGSWEITNVSWIENAAANSYSLEIGHALPENITISLVSSNGNLNLTEINITKGETVSQAVTWTPTSLDPDASIQPVTTQLDISILGGHINIPHQGNVGICNRTLIIQQLILDSITDISSCVNVTLAHLAIIADLTLNNTGLTALKKVDLNYLLAIREFNLSDNSISTLVNDTFAASMPTSISFSNNQLNSIETTAFLSGVAGDNDLNVNLTNNNITAVTLATGFLGGSATEKFVGGEFDLSFNQIDSIVATSFADFNPNILHLNDNDIASIPDNAFPNATGLYELYLANNLLNTIPTNTFASLSQLDILDLGNNLLTTIPSDAFATPNTVSSLNLNGNSIASIQAAAFQPLSALTQLNLSNNLLTAVPSNTFADLVNLTKLDLANNNITMVSPDVFDNLNVTVIDLSNNSIATLPLNLLENHNDPSGITNFDVSNNQLTGGSWEITNVSWIESETVPGRFSLRIGHALPERLTIDITSNNGDLNATKFIITKGETVSDTVSWTAANSSVTQANILPTITPIAIEILGGHINIPQIGGSGICDRTPIIQTLILDSIDGILACQDVTLAQLTSINNLPLHSQSILALKVIDFDYLSSLSQFNISDNNLTTLLNGTFDSLSPESISLANNNLTAVQSTALLSGVAGDNNVNIDLSNNALVSSSLASGFLNGSSTEQFVGGEFDLSFNQINAVVAASFANFNPSVLRLNNNNIASISDSAFPDATGLYELYLANNSLNTIPAAAFNSLSILLNLDLSGNQLTSVPTSPLSSLGTLATLSLNGNSISSIDADAFTALTALTTLNVNTNQINSIAEDAFTSLNTLLNLDLSTNRLTALPANVFEPLDELIYLNLNYNNLTSISSNAFTALDKLERLNLFSNQISSIAADAFAGLTATNIELGANDLTTLPLNLFANHANPSNITSFDVADNPLVGDSWEITTVNWVEDSNNPGNFTLQIGHALPENIAIDITSNNGNLNASSIVITKGLTTSDKVSWTATGSATQAYILPNTATINIETLSGHINIPQIGNYAGICDRSDTIQRLILDSIDGISACQDVTLAHLQAITDLALNNAGLTDLTAIDLDYLTMISEFDLSDNTLTSLVDGTLNQVAPVSVNFANNNITSISALALFTDNQADNDININLSSNAITTATLDSGFLTANGKQKFVGGEFDLSFNQINAVVAASFADFNPRALRLNNNNIASIADNAFANATGLFDLNLGNNLLPAISANTFTSLDSLGILTLNGNQISTIPSDAFAPLSGLINLNLGNNLLTTVPSDAFATPNILSGLNLNGNRISSVQADAFQPLAGLIILDLGNNLLTTVPSDAFASLTSLFILSLNNNSVTSINANAFAALTQLNLLDLSNNSIASIDTDAFNNTNVTDIDLSNNSIAMLPLNLLENHTDPSSITSFNVSGNQLNGDSWEITNVSWVEDSNNPGNFTLEIGHALTENLTITIASSNGALNATMLNITKGQTVSNTVTWTNSSVGAQAYIAPTIEQVNITALSGHIIIPTMNNADGVCDRSAPVTALLLTAVNTGTCEALSISQLTNLTGDLDWSNQALQTLSALFVNDLDNLTGIDSFILANNSLTSLVNGTLNHTTPESVDFANNSIATIGKLALFTTNQGSDDINVNLSSNAITTTTLGSGFLTSNGVQQLVGGEFDLSFNQIDSIVATSFAGFNPSILHLNDNDIASIADNALASAAGTTELYLSNNQLSNIALNTFTGLSSLNKLDLANNSIATIVVGAFASINVTDIDLTNNSITDLALNLLANHADPSSITNFDIAGNPLASSSWAITNVNWVENSTNPGNFTLEIGHALPEDITIDITSSNGDLSVTMLNITKGETISNTVTWTNSSVGAEVYIIPTATQINITAFSGHIIIPTLNNAGGICDRSDPVTALLLTAVNTTTCEALSISQLTNLTGDLDWSNQALQTLSALFVNDLDNLTGIDNFILANNSLTRLVNGTLNQTTPESVDFANNNIATIGKLALFTTNQGSDNINVNLSNNAITTTTLGSGFLTSNGAQQLVGGEFDLSFNQIDSIVATSFAGFNPSILHLNDNDIDSIADSSFSDAAATSQLYLRNNAIVNIAAMTLAGLTNLTKIDLANNSIATIAVGAFENINVTDIDLTDNSITDLPLNLLANHADPSSISNFDIAGNPLTSSSWAITNVSWVEDNTNPGNFTLEIGHALTEDISISITSSNGVLNATLLNITKGETVSNTVTWTNSSVGAQAYIVPTIEQVNITALSGHIIIPTLNNAGGVCNRSQPVTDFLLTALNTAACEALSIAQLLNLAGVADLSNQNIIDADIRDFDLDNLTGIDSFILANNSLTRLVNGTLNQTTPESVDFANNSIATIGKLALFTTHQGNDDINVNLSNNAITTATLASGFLNANGNQQFVGGDFDLSFNQIDSIVATSFDGFNPSILHLNDNDIASIADSSFSDAAATSQLYLRNNAIVNIAPTTLAGLTNLTKLDLANNSIATIVVGAFASINVTDIDLTDNSIHDLPLNLLANHADPSSITNFDIAGNPVASSSWAITTVNWLENNGNFSLQLGHALTEDITINITSTTGSLNVTSINITKGDTVSDTVTWTNSSVGAQAHIAPVMEQINVTALSGHINIPTLNNAGGVCNRSQPVTDFLLTNLNTAACEALSIAQLLNLAGVADLSNQNIIDADIRDFDLDNLTGIDSFILANNSLTRLVNGTLNQTMPESVDFANNSIATIGKLALFTTNQGNDDINVNLSNNAITTATLASGFLNANGNQQFVGGEFDLSFNLVDSIVATSFAGFNPSILHLNDNDIASITDNALASAAGTTELYLNNNLLSNIALNTFTGLSSLNKLDLANNSIATIVVGAFENINVTDIDLTDNSITDLPLNLLANHADPSSISNFDIAGNPLASSSWAITNVNWIENNGNFSLQLGHALTEDITINITSTTGSLNVSSINITKGDTVSDTVTWSAGTVGAQAYIAPTIEQINVTALSGHINIPTLNNAGGVCNRSQPVTDFLLTALNTDTCEALSIAQLINLAGVADLSNQNIIDADIRDFDLDNLTGIDSFILANNSLTRLVNGTLNQTTPESVDFANNSIATIGKLALFTTNQGSDDINVNLSSNNITAATLASGFLTANGNQQFVGGEFDLSFNQIDSIVATSFDGFNPSILRLNDNDIASIADSSFSDAAATSQLYLRNNAIVNIAAMTLAGLTKLSKLDLANNSIATIAIGAFESINVTDIDLTDNSITDLPLNLLANHADPSSISNFDIAGNPLASSSWAITNVNWIMDASNTNQYTLQLDHSLPEDITINITSSNGNLNVASINITKGDTVSDAVVWTATAGSIGADVFIVPTLEQITVTSLSGHINIPTLADGGICDRSPAVITLLLEATAVDNCAAVTQSQLTALSASLNWNNQSLNALLSYDLDNLTGIDSFILSNNGLTSLVDGMMNQTTPDAVNFASNSIATIGKLALFTTNQGSDDINVNLSSNNITAATLASGFLTASGQQKFVGGEFDLSFNQIDSIVATSFDGFNPNILRLNDNEIVSIPASIFSSATQMTELYLQSNNITAIGDSAFSGLSALTTLTLANNNITALSTNALTGLTASSLDLSNNAIVNITATALAGLTNLNQLDLASNSIATIAVGAFESINVTDIALTDNSITDLPLNLLANHADPSSISNFDIAGNPLASSSWAITNVSWVEDSNNPDNFTLEIGHALPEDITINIASTTGSLSTTSIDITKGNTVSDTVTWTNSSIGSAVQIMPTAVQINVTILGGHINIPQLNAVPSFTPLASRSVVAEHLFDAIVLPAANGGSGALSYSLFETNSTTASLPGSLTFTNATRTLNGSIDTAGNYNLTYSVIDANDASANATFILVVQPNLRPVFADNSNLSYTVVPNEELVNITLPQASTSNEVITYSLINISEDDLPADLVFNAIDRTIKGNTTATGIYAFMFVATDSLDGDTASINLTIDIRSNLPPVFNATEIDSIRIQTVRQDADGGINITLPSVQNGNGPFNYTFQTNGAAGLPAGLQFNDTAGLPSGLQFRATTSGAIQGKPTEFGDFNISVTVTDADLYSNSFSFTLTIIESLGFATDLPANYTVTPGVAFTSGELPAGTGGIPSDAGNYTYKLSGDLPTGLSFNSTSRMITGTTSVMGSYPITYIVTDNEGIEYAEDTVLVVQLLTPEFMTQVDDMTMLIGQNINMTLPEVNTHNMTTITYSISEQQGLKFNPATRQLNGSIARLGTHTITYRAVDTAGQETEQVFDITVKANDAIIEDIMWRQALSIADQTVNSVKKRFDLVDQNRLPYVLAENFQGANFQVSKSNWLGLWTNIGTANLENRENNFNWNGSVETTQIGIDFSGEHFLAGVALETVSTSSAFTAKAEAFNNYTGNFNIDDLELQSVYGGFYQDKFNIWAIASSGSGSASLDITAQNQTSLLSSGVDYSMTAFGGAFNINRVLNIGFEGIASASLDFADNTISNITSTSASRSKVFGSIEFGKWTQKPMTRDCLTWQPSLEFAFRNDSSDTASGTNSASGLELTAAVEIDYKLINLEIGVRSFSSDNYTETAQWFTFHIVPRTATGLNVELSQSLGDTGSVANSIFNNAELNDIVDGMSQSTELSSIGKISYGWAKDTGTYRLFTQGKSQVNHAQTDALFGDVSAMFDSETGLVWDSIGIAFDSADRKYTWSTDIQGGMINKYFNNIKDNTEATTVNFTAEIKF